MSSALKELAHMIIEGKHLLFKRMEDLYQDLFQCLSKRDMVRFACSCKAVYEFFQKRTVQKHWKRLTCEEFINSRVSILNQQKKAAHPFQVVRATHPYIMPGNDSNFELYKFITRMVSDYNPQEYFSYSRECPFHVVEDSSYMTTTIPTVSSFLLMISFPDDGEEAQFYSGAEHIATIHQPRRGIPYYPSGSENIAFFYNVLSLFSVRYKGKATFLRCIFIFDSVVNDRQYIGNGITYHSTFFGVHVVHEHGVIHL